jgi:tetratricopeptide (TPR) repeat protein
LLLSIGITRRARDTTRWAGDLAGFVTAGPIYAVALAGLLRGEQLLDINIFYITAFIFAALLAARGLHRVAEAIDGRQAPAALRIALPSLALASLPALAASRWDTVEMRDNWVAHDYARALLSSMPRDADLYAQGDHELFPIMYVQKIDQYRNDVRVFDAATPDDTTDVYGKTRVSRPSRPVLTTIPLGRLDRTTVPWGLALLLVGDDHVPPSPRPPPPLERQPPKSAAALGRLERDLLARYHLFQARYSLEVDDIESALAEIGYGVDIARENPKCLNNFAALCARHGLSKQAKALWTRAIELDPGYELARTNLATLERTFSPPVASP